MFNTTNSTTSKTRSDILKDIVLDVFMKREDFTIDLIIELMNKAYDAGVANGCSAFYSNNSNNSFISGVAKNDQSWYSPYGKSVCSGLTTHDIAKLMPIAHIQNLKI